MYLRADWHNLESYGVHNDRALDLRLKAECQEKFEELYGHECFIRVFGKSWL